MNIFFLDRDPLFAAKAHCDQHVVKMAIEYAQILSTALYLTDSTINEFVYKPTHKHHPCTVWATKSLQHWKWLWLLGHYVGNEYTKRYNKIHKSTRVLRCLPVPSNIKNNGWKDPPQAMPEEFRRSNVVEAYRNFYLNDKIRFAKWSYSDEPEWWIENIGKEA